MSSEKIRYVNLAPIIIRMMIENGGCITLREIELMLGLDRQQAYKRMWWLMRRGIVYRRTRGYYCLTQEAKKTYQP